MVRLERIGSKGWRPLRAGQHLIGIVFALIWAGQAVCAQTGTETRATGDGSVIELPAVIIESQPSGEPQPESLGRPAVVYEIGKQLELRAFWKNGVWFETADQAFRLHVGGLIHADMGWWNAEDQVMNGVGGVGPLNDGAAFRRGRVHIRGQMYETVVWNLEVGYENRLPQFFNAYAEFPQLPFLGNVRLGHFREPFGMDALTGYNDLTFVERGLVGDPFTPFFNMGTMVFGTLFEENATYATGIFRTNSDNFNAADFGDGNYSYTSRLTASPWYHEGHHVLHLGVAHSYRVLPQLNATGQPVTSGGLRRINVLSRPEYRLNAPNFISTGVIEADHENLLGAEVGASVGPFLLQGEYMAAFLNDALPPAGAVRDSYVFHGFYVQASYFLTGEHRPYSRKDGFFGMVRPYENFFFVRGGESRRGPLLFGRGAWELACRYSQVDLNSGNIEGGTLRDATFGLNWYLNPNVRILLNYLLIWRDVAGNSSDGLTQAFGTRFQIEF